MRAVIAILFFLWITGVACGFFSVMPVVVASFGALLAFLLYRSSFSIQSIVAGVLVLFLGLTFGHTYSSLPLTSCDIVFPSQATLSEIRGMYATYTLSVFRVDDQCSLLVYVPRSLNLIEGAKVEISGKAEKVAKAFAGIPGYAAFLQEDGIDVVFRNPSITIQAQGSSLISRARLRTMGMFAEVFREPDSAVLTAMMIGDRGMIPRAITNSFQRSGIIHILSISGFHVSLLAGVLALLLLRLPVPVWGYYIIVGSVLWLYIIAIGAPPAALRAGMFWTLLIIAYRTHALVGLPTVILFTVCCLVTFDPSLVRSIGFQLSIAAVTGIGVGVFVLRHIHVPSRIRPIAVSLAVSLGATLATVPLTAYHFGNISIIGILVNIIIVPLVAILMYVALGTLVLSMIYMPLALILSFITHMLMNSVLIVADIAARVPYGSFQDLHVPLWTVGLYYVVFCMAIFIGMRVSHIRARELWI